MITKAAKKIVKKIFFDLGYDIVPAVKNRDNQKGYYLYSYINENGELDLEQYRKVQSEGNKKKLERVWVKEKNIVNLANYIESHMDAVSFGICHGTRRGMEQGWFADALECEVIGTEISDTATDFPNTIQWDFHDVKDEWLGRVDFIYSNSFDHSYDPEKCINAWMSCLKPGGVCIIEHSSAHDEKEASELDPFGASIINMPYLILKWSKGKFGVVDVVDSPDKYDSLQYQKSLILRKF